MSSEKQKLMEICHLPYSIKTNGEYCNTCFKNIPVEKIVVENKNGEYTYEYTASEENISNLGNLDFENMFEINLIHNESNFKAKAQMQNQDEKAKKSIYYVGKYILYTLNICPDDIEFVEHYQNLFRNQNRINDVDLSKKLDKEFTTIGFYVPLQIEIGGKFYFKVDELFKNTLSNNAVNASLNLDYKTIKDTMNLMKISSQDLKSKFGHIETKRIGGNTLEDNFEIWKKTITLDNASVIGYKNLKNIDSLISNELSFKIRVALDLLNDKYNARKEYMRVYEKILKIKNDKILNKKIQIKKKESYQEGECHISEIPKIEVESFSFRDKGKVFQRIERNYKHSFENIIVGWKIKENWNDGTNGEWEVKTCPLLTHEMDANFISQRFRGQNFTVEVYTMVTPN